LDDDRKTAAIEGLKSLQDWSKWLVGINAGVIGLLSIAVKDLQYSVPCLKAFPSLALLCLIVSVAAAAYLVGVIPALLYRVHTGDSGELESGTSEESENGADRPRYHCAADRARYYCPATKEPHDYRVRFWLIGRQMELRWMARAQHIAFIAGFVLIFLSVIVHQLWPMEHEPKIPTRHNGSATVISPKLQNGGLRFAASRTTETWNM
jgi:hypothetical protein